MCSFDVLAFEIPGVSGWPGMDVPDNMYITYVSQQLPEHVENPQRFRLTSFIS